MGKMPETMIRLEWDEKWLPPDWRRAEIELAVRENIAETRLVDPSEICFHHVFLAADLNGELVFVFGVDGSDAFHCKYVEKPRWESFNGEADQEPPHGRY